MKKKLLLAFAIVLSVVFVLVACNDDSGTGGNNQPAATEPAATEPTAQNGDDNGDDNQADASEWIMAPTTRLIMATGSTAGVYYPLGGGMAGVISNRTNLQITANASGASIDNLRQLFLGDAHIALAQNDVMYYAFSGTSIWEDDIPIPNLATLMTLYPETIQIVVLADSGLYSVEDLIGQRVSIGAIGSGVEANALQILAAYGITRDDFTVVQQNFGDSADSMRDGLLDAFFVTSGTPTAAIMDLGMARDLRILSLSESAMASLQADYPFYVPVTITSDDYGFINAPVYTLAVLATLVTTTDLDEQVAYDIVRAVIEGRADVEAAHARGRHISPENSVYGISVPLHPGAARYFRERGVY
ncbi:MAG: TAXI family TRAP transporter solute-binding subunit [Oscillospiraceae bacterium]|nr:TAXI family TRAP transporter solute-binding subunit [Oscillospiraceae bacterium]